MSLNPFSDGNKYRRYANNVVGAGNSLYKASEKLKNGIDDTIPKHFSGDTASYAANLANEICQKINAQASKLKTAGAGIKRIVEINDID